MKIMADNLTPKIMHEMDRLNVAARSLRKAQFAIELAQGGMPLDKALAQVQILPKTFVAALVVLKSWRGKIEV